MELLKDTTRATTKRMRENNREYARRDGMEMGLSDSVLVLYTLLGVIFWKYWNVVSFFTTNETLDWYRITRTIKNKIPNRAETWYLAL